MPRKLLVALLLAAACMIALNAQNSKATAKRISVSVDAAKTAPPISPYIYGQFIEHIGDLINRSLWAEMLDDRKFYNDVNSKPVASAGGRRGGGGRGGRPAAQWRPIGPDAAVAMDKKNPYVGVHTPLIQLAGNEARGIQQDGIALRKGKAYTGRVVLAGSPGAKVTVSLVWGDGPGGKQSVVPAVGAAYAKFPLKFTAGADTNDARLEISGTGQGSFHIGAVSLMPADNIHGFRPDVIALLKAQRSGMWRWPGGNYLSAFEWRDAIGDPDKRAPKLDPVRSGFQPNDVGTDEFMTLMDLLGVDPFISVNSGFGDAWSAAQLVEYCNGAVTTPMGKLRAANGHPAPYKIKWWGIGNEMYGSGWQFGYMAPTQYFFKHNMFGEAMRKVDPSITLLATGATPDEMTIYGLALPLVGKLIPDFGSAGDWDYGLFTHCFDYIDIMSEHFYSYPGQRFDHSALKPGRFSRANYMVQVDEPLVEWARRPANRVREKVEAYDEYLQRIPALKTRRIPMVIDEWAYSGGGGGNNLRGALANAMVLQEMFRHSGLIKMAGHTMGTGSIDYNATESALNTTGMFFKLYRDHFGSIPVEVGGNSPVPPPMYPVGGDQPKINAGSPTYPVDVSAAMTSDGKFLTVAIINANESTQEIDLSLKGIALSGKGRMWRMTGDSLTAATGLGRNEVRIVESLLTETPKALTVAPISIEIYEFAKR